MTKDDVISLRFQPGTRIVWHGLHEQQSDSIKYPGYPIDSFSQLE